MQGALSICLNAKHVVAEQKTQCLVETKKELPGMQLHVAPRGTVHHSEAAMLISNSVILRLLDLFFGNGHLHLVLGMFI